MMYEARSKVVEAEPVTLAGEALMAVAIDDRAHLIPAAAFIALFDELVKTVEEPAPAPEPKPEPPRKPKSRDRVVASKALNEPEKCPVVGPRPPVKKLPATDTLAHLVLVAVRDSAKPQRAPELFGVVSKRRETTFASVQASLSDLRAKGLVTSSGPRINRVWEMV